MAGKGSVRLEWDGKAEAVKAAEAFVPLAVPYLHSIGTKGSGNAAVLGDVLNALRVVESVVPAAGKFNFAYVNLQTAISSVKETDADRLSATVQILLLAKKLLAKDGIVVVRPPNQIACAISVLAGETLDGHSVKMASVMRGYDGFTELLVACPSGRKVPACSWRWWSEMVDSCCPKSGTSLFVGLDEAVSGFLGRAKLDGSNARAAMVFPLETVVRNCSSFKQNAADAWKAVQDEASRQPAYFCGIDVYEAHFIFDGAAGQQGFAE